MRISLGPNQRARRRSTLLVTGGLLLAFALAGCDSSGGVGDAPASPGADSAEPGEPSSTPSRPASRLTAVPNSSDGCLPAVARGTVIAMTGPELRPTGGPITVTDVALGPSAVGSMTLTGTAAALYTYDEVTHPSRMVADSLAELDPNRGQYVRGSKGPLVGTEFDAGTRGFVPLLEVEVRWPRRGFPQGTGFTLTPPDLTITYTDSDGSSKRLTEKTFVTVASAKNGCSL